jgi:hypothetical protein
MPTGYTAKLVESGQSFEEFIFGCARAFGALIDMRDEPMDAPIPERFEIGGHYEKAFAKAKDKLAELQKLTPEQQLEFGASEKDRQVTSAEKYRGEAIHENTRINNMVEIVSKWEPPTKDHVELKKFMLQQLNTSLRDSTYYGDQVEKLLKKDPKKFYEEVVQSEENSVVYYAEEQAKEIKRNMERNRWVADLRKSVKNFKQEKTAAGQV